MQKMYITNNAVNFFLYVISGQKFRNDFRKLLECCEKKENEASANIPESNTKVTSIEHNIALNHYLKIKSDKVLRCSPDSVLQSSQSYRINAAHYKPITPSFQAFGITLDQ